MALRTNSAPYVRSKNSTLKKMLLLLAALVVVWAFSIITNFKFDGMVEEIGRKVEELDEFGDFAGYKFGYYNLGIKAILMVVVALLTGTVCDVIVSIIKNKKFNLKLIGHDIVHNYSYISTMIFALTLPVYVSYYIVVLGSVFAVVVCKYFFGGFGRNVFNPAIMARLFVGLCFTGAFSTIPEFMMSKTQAVGLDFVSGATLTSAYNGSLNWLGTSYVDNGAIYSGIFKDFGLKDLLLGNYVGALGETFTLVILVLGIVLSVLKVINWRTPAFYLGTVAVTSLLIALFCHYQQPLNYVLYHLSLGGLMFGAVFMLTDPVTGPTSNFGKCLMAGFAGIMTVLIRLKGGYPEGVAFSIALANFISPAIDYVVKGKTDKNLPVKYGFTFGLPVVGCVLLTLMAFNLNGGQTVYEKRGMDAAKYDYIAETIGVKEGDYFKSVDYTASTSNLTTKVYNSDKEYSLEKAYEICNSEDQVVAISFLVKGDAVDVSTGYANISVTPMAYVSFNLDGTIYNVGIVTANTAGYALEAGIKDAASALAGKNQTNYNLDASETLIENVNGNALITGATYSSKMIFDLIEKGYAEFAAYKG